MSLEGELKGGLSHALSHQASPGGCSQLQKFSARKLSYYCCPQNAGGFTAQAAQNLFGRISRWFIGRDQGGRDESGWWTRGSLSGVPTAAGCATCSVMRRGNAWRVEGERMKYRALVTLLDFA